MHLHQLKRVNLLLREYLKPKVKNVLYIYSAENDLSDLNKELESEILNKHLDNLDFTQNYESRNH